MLLERVVSYTDSLAVTPLGAVSLVQASYPGENVTGGKPPFSDTYLVSSRDLALTASASDRFRAVEALQRYELLSDHGRAWFFSTPFDADFEMGLVPTSELAEAVAAPFSLQDVVRVDYDSYLVYGLDEVLPRSRVERLGVGDGSITAMEYDLDRAEQVLLESPWTLDVRRAPLPSYHSSFSSLASERLEFTVFLPQDMHDFLFELVSQNSASFSLGSHMAAVVPKSYHEGEFWFLDVLGLRAALLPPDVIEANRAADPPF